MAAGNDTVQVGIATYDTTVHFYSLQANQSQAQMLVMPDVEEVYSVSSASVVVPLHHSYHLVTCCLSNSPGSADLTLQARKSMYSLEVVFTHAAYFTASFSSQQHNVGL